MRRLPVFFNIEGKKIGVIGGGNAAVIKIKTLLDFEADIVVIAPEVQREIEELQKQRKLIWMQRNYQPEDINLFSFLILAAEEKINEETAEICRQKKIPFLSVSKRIEGDFIFPSHKKQGDITIAVSTNGKYPLLAKKICEQIFLPDEEMMNFLEEKRAFLLEKEKDSKKRKKILQNIINDSILDQKNYKQRIEELIKGELE